MSNLVRILLPHGDVSAAKNQLAPRLDGVAGKRIGIVDNDMWQSMHILAGELTDVLTGAYGAAGVQTITYHYGTGADRQEIQTKLERLSQEVDAVVSGLGN